MGCFSSHFCRGKRGVRFCFSNLSHHPWAFTTFSKFHGLNMYYEKNYVYFNLNLHIMNFIWCTLFTLSMEPVILQISQTSHSLLHSPSKPFLAWEVWSGLLPVPSKLLSTAGYSRCSYTLWFHSILPGWEVQDYGQHCGSQKHNQDLQNDTAAI